jgi:uncharacterized protein
MDAFRNPAQDEIGVFLRKIRTIAVIGISANASRPSHRVSHSMQGFGCRIVPINPALDTVLNERCWPTLEAAVAGVSGIELVDVFRLPKFVAAIVDDAIQLKIPALWFQDGVVDEAAALRAQSAGIFTVMNRCVFRDRAALAAG